MNNKDNSINPGIAETLTIQYNYIMNKDQLKPLTTKALIEKASITRWNRHQQYNCLWANPTKPKNINST